MTTGLQRHHRYFLLGAILIAILFHYRIYSNNFLEWDERVYLYLSENMNWTLGNYSTQGSFIDEILPGKVYSAEIFHHPPLIPYLIKIFSIPMVPLLAARTLNLVLIFASIYFVFRLTLSLSGFKGAMLATTFWIFCPIFNLESNLVHLDFPTTVLILAGTWYFYSYLDQNRMVYLLLSGGAFALAMLTKFTAPIFVLLPVFLALTKKDFFQERASAFLYFGLVALGFSWWATIVFKYGSLLPVEFIGDSTEEVAHSPYLDKMRMRSWYHIWIYFTAVFPLFILYISTLGKNFFNAIKNWDGFSDTSIPIRFLALVNISSILAVVGFDIANSISNKVWVFRHIMPVFPFIYITTTYALISLLNQKNQILKKAGILLSCLTLILMGSSTYYTIKNPWNIKVIPSIFGWIPELKPFFI
jgi:4-amino-4-deoxy-L-arabinose transferase-like glycosyltransferase